MKKTVGVILAGGQGTRMGMDKTGGDKGLLKLGGQSLLSRVVDRLAVQVSQLALNANGPAARFNALNLPVIKDSIGGFAGPLAGILAGMDWAANQGATHVVTAAADTPFFPVNLVKQLQYGLENENKPIALAATPHPERGLLRQPTFGLWPVSLREDLRVSLKGGVRKIVQWADRHGTAIVPFEVGEFDPFFNVNTPQDMVQAQALLKAEL